MPEKKYDLNPLTQEEQRRYLEIKFYFMIKKLLESFDYSAGVYEVIGTLSQLYGNNPSILRYIIQTMRKNNSLLKPTLEEAIIMLYRGDEYSIRELREMLGTSFNTIYKVLPKYVEDNQPMYFPKLSGEQYIEVEKFIKNSKKIFHILNM
jgi:hypothetical protein